MAEIPRYQKVKNSSLSKRLIKRFPQSALDYALLAQIVLAQLLLQQALLRNKEFYQRQSIARADRLLLVQLGERALNPFRHKQILVTRIL